jgi:hypothetical protein
MLNSMTMGLKDFTRDAFGHERFTSIDRVENNGLDVSGAFHSDQWGDFQTYFRFQLSPGVRSIDWILGRQPNGHLMLSS